LARACRELWGGSLFAAGALEWRIRALSKSVGRSLTDTARPMCDTRVGGPGGGRSQALSRLHRRRVFLGVARPEFLRRGRLHLPSPHALRKGLRACHPPVRVYVRLTA